MFILPLLELAGAFNGHCDREGECACPLLGREGAHMRGCRCFGKSSVNEAEAFFDLLKAGFDTFEAGIVMPQDIGSLQGL